MKLFVSILSIYLLYLCCYPCAGDNCADEAEHEAFVHSEEPDDDCQEPEACTPFCFDGCCTAHIICEVTGPSFNINVFNTEEPNFHFSESHFPQLTANIWQPPKIRDYTSVLEF